MACSMLGKVRDMHHGRAAPMRIGRITHARDMRDTESSSSNMGSDGGASLRILA